MSRVWPTSGMYLDLYVRRPARVVLRAQGGCSTRADAVKFGSTQRGGVL